MPQRVTRRGGDAMNGDPAVLGVPGEHRPGAAGVHHLVAIHAAVDGGDDLGIALQIGPQLTRLHGPRRRQGRHRGGRRGCGPDGAVGQQAQHHDDQDEDADVEGEQPDRLGPQPAPLVRRRWLGRRPVGATSIRALAGLSGPLPGSSGCGPAVKFGDAAVPGRSRGSRRDGRGGPAEVGTGRAAQPLERAGSPASGTSAPAGRLRAALGRRSSRVRRAFGVRVAQLTPRRRPSEGIGPAHESPPRPGRSPGVTTGTTENGGGGVIEHTLVAAGFQTPQ